MIVHPKIRGFICTTAHPTGCEARIRDEVAYVSSQGSLPQSSFKRVLVIGASTGYGLSSRIVAAFGAGAATLGLAYEKPPTEKRTASAGWYNTVAFEKVANEAGLYAKTLMGDAFSEAMKRQVIDCVKADWPEGIDLVIYSLASPRREHPHNGQVYHSTLKPIGQAYTNKTVDFMTGKVSEISLEPASVDEISQTVQVMGGDDWAMWIDALQSAGVLAQGFKTVAYSYIGSELTYPIYRDGTIGQAKKHLEVTAKGLDIKLRPLKGKAYLSVNKAVVTQASSAIPVVPLYMSLLFKVMKEKNLHEDCIAQIWRLFRDYLATDKPKSLDEEGRIRLDDWELRPDVQAAVKTAWAKVDSDNIFIESDLEGYQRAFEGLFGFANDKINYDEAVEIVQLIPSLLSSDLE